MVLITSITALLSTTNYTILRDPQWPAAITGISSLAVIDNLNKDSIEAETIMGLERLHIRTSHNPAASGITLKSFLPQC